MDFTIAPDRCAGATELLCGLDARWPKCQLISEMAGKIKEFQKAIADENDWKEFVLGGSEHVC